MEAAQVVIDLLPRTLKISKDLAQTPFIVQCLTKNIILQVVVRIPNITPPTIKNTVPLNTNGRMSLLQPLTRLRVLLIDVDHCEHWYLGPHYMYVSNSKQMAKVI